MSQRAERRIATPAGDVRVRIHNPSARALSPEVKFPVAQQQIAAVVRWARQALEPSAT